MGKLALVGELENEVRTFEVVHHASEAKELSDGGARLMLAISDVAEEGPNAVMAILKATPRAAEMLALLHEETNEILTLAYWLEEENEHSGKGEEESVSAEVVE